MKSSNLVPIRGQFEDARAFLHHIAADGDNIDQLVIVTLRKDGGMGHAQLNMTRSNMAFASLLLGHWALEDEL